MTCCVKHILTVNAISIFNVYLCLFGSVYNELLYDDENVHEDLKVMLFCTSARKVKFKRHYVLFWHFLVKINGRFSV